MRVPKGARITEEDRREMAQFEKFLRTVADGKSQQEAYAETYGEVVYESKPACLDCAQTDGHTESCALSFGDEFAQREGEVPV